MRKPSKTSQGSIGGTRGPPKWPRGLLGVKNDGPDGLCRARARSGSRVRAQAEGGGGLRGAPGGAVWGTARHQGCAVPRAGPGGLAAARPEPAASVGPGWAARSSRAVEKPNRFLTVGGGVSAVIYRALYRVALVRCPIPPRLIEALRSRCARSRRL